MRLPRLLLACLLSLGVSLQGVAQVLPMRADCPMLQATAMEHASMEHMSMETAADAHMAAHPDCDPGATDSDPDAGHKAGTCHGAACLTAGPAVPSCLLLPASRPAVQSVPVAGAPSFQSRTVLLPGRPPSLI